MSKRRLPTSSSSSVHHHDHREQQALNGRVGHLVTILPLTRRHGNEKKLFVEPFLWSVDVAAYLAVRDWNRRSSPFVKDLSSLIEKSSCNWSFSIDMRDSQLVPLTAVAQLQDATQNINSYQQPLAIVGAHASPSTSLLAEMAGVYGIPVISPGASSRQLDNSIMYPTFARTIPTNSADSQSLLQYWEGLGVDNMAVFYLDNDYGTSFVHDLQAAAKNHPMQVTEVPFTRDSLAESMERLRTISQETNYFFGILGEDGWREIAVELYRAGLMGQPQTAWLLSEVSAELVGTEWHSDDFENGSDNNNANNVGNNNANNLIQDYEFHRDLASAINGTGCLLLRPPNGALELMDAEWQALQQDPLEWKDYKSKHIPYLEIPNDDDGPSEEDNLNGPENFVVGSSTYSLLAYDAVMALGLAACASPGQENPKPAELLKRLAGVTFDGASGYVGFEETTLSRKVEGMEYQILNLLSEEHGKDEGHDDLHTAIQIRGHESAIIMESDEDEHTHIISDTAEFLYPTWTMLPPPTMTVEEGLNLVGTGMRASCYTLCGISVFVTFAAGIWTYVNRNKPCVRESQPIFLGLLCIGAFLMATAMIPSGFQEPMSQNDLNVGCMSIPWLLASGFTLAYAALYSKIRRINQVFKSAQAFQRVKIQPRDVLKPLITLMILNFSVLAVWTIVAPLRWVRTVTQTDESGRPRESFGSCVPDSPATWGCLMVVLTVNVVALILSNYESYLAKNLPSRWNESFYVGLTNFVILETAIISAPVFVLVKQAPDSFLVVNTLATFVMVMAVMLPAFLPKILIDNTIQRPKILRLNRLVSAYPSRLNPMGLFSGASFRPKPATPTQNKNSRNPSALVAYNESSGPLSQPPRRRVSFSLPRSQGTQGTSRSTLLADSSRELTQTNSAKAFEADTDYAEEETNSDKATDADKDVIEEQIDDADVSIGRVWEELPSAL